MKAIGGRVVVPDEGQVVFPFFGGVADRPVTAQSLKKRLIPGDGRRDQPQLTQHILYVGGGNEAEIKGDKLLPENVGQKPFALVVAAQPGDGSRGQVLPAAANEVVDELVLNVAFFSNEGHKNLQNLWVVALTPRPLSQTAYLYP